MTLHYRRNDAPKKKHYREYKKYLREDFKYSCVYCHIHENEYGGPWHFAVEHFRPKKKFPHLVVEYGNLLYSCDACNIFKSDDWPSDNPLVDGMGYLDPCEHDYDNYFKENGHFEIIGLTPVGSYMVENLNLNRNQLRLIRERRSKSEANYARIISLFERLLQELQNKVNTVGLSAEEKKLAQEEIQNLREVYEAQKLAWQKRYEPLFFLEDYS